MYTIYVDGFKNCFAESLEMAVRKGKKLQSRGKIQVEAPSGNITDLADLELFLEKEALFLAEW